MKSPHENMLKAIHATKRKGAIPVIAEIKRFTPAQGDLLGDRQLKNIVEAYQAGGAACLSVVTGSWFKGSVSMLAEVAASSQLPVLRKDTIVSRDQITQSRDLGAQAVLLTTKILQKSHLDKMIDHCINIGICPFIEISSQSELNCVNPSPEMIIGIANRDIAKKEMDTESGLKSLELIGNIKARAGAIISASGISSRAEAETLIASGFDGLLVGTSLLRADNIKNKLAELVNATLPGRPVKILG